MSDRMPAAGVSLALLAGDRDGATHWLESLLESGGVGVLRERTGRDALQRARATRPDVIIVDTDLSDQEGVQLSRALRADPRITTSPPILLQADGTAGAAVVRGVTALKSTARLADVVGRLSAAAFAVLAPDTDAGGARRLAERLAQSIRTRTTPPDATLAAPGVRVRCGYEAVANMGYAPIEPVELLVRASAALRTGKPEGGGWTRRFDEGIAST